jgi:hypothetical protein
MKTLVKNLTVVWLLLALGAGLIREAHAQGTIMLNNLANSDASLIARTNGLASISWGTNNVWSLLNQDVNFQLWAGPNLASLQLIHTWLLSDGSAKGISLGGGHFADPTHAAYSIFGVEAGRTVFVQIYAWPGDYDRIGDASGRGLPIAAVAFQNPSGGNGVAPMSLVGMPALFMSVVSSGVTQPVLSISRVGNYVIVSWTNGPAYILQQTPSLASDHVWTDIGAANPSGPIAITNTPLFFRVRSP